MHGGYRQTETDGQTDRQDYYGNTALCTNVHRAVKHVCFRWQIRKRIWRN